IIAARIGWPQTYMVMGGILLAIGIAGLFAPDAEARRALGASEEELAELRQPGQLKPKVRNWALTAVGLLWAWALATVIVFMVRSMTALPEDRPDPTEFTTRYGPLIVIATIVLPALIAGWLAKLEREGRHVITAEDAGKVRSSAMADHLYRALVRPLTELDRES